MKIILFLSSPFLFLLLQQKKRKNIYGKYVEIFLFNTTWLFLYILILVRLISVMVDNILFDPSMDRISIWWKCMQVSSLHLMRIFFQKNPPTSHSIKPTKLVMRKFSKNHKYFIKIQGQFWIIMESQSYNLHLMNSHGKYSYPCSKIQKGNLSVDDDASVFFAAC